MQKKAFSSVCSQRLPNKSQSSAHQVTHFLFDNDTDVFDGWKRLTGTQIYTDSEHFYL